MKIVKRLLTAGQSPTQTVTSFSMIAHSLSSSRIHVSATHLLVEIEMGHFAPTWKHRVQCWFEKKSVKLNIQSICINCSKSMEFTIVLIRGIFDNSKNPPTLPKKKKKEKRNGTLWDLVREISKSLEVHGLFGFNSQKMLSKWKRALSTWPT